MGAFYLIRIDLKSGHGISLYRVAHQEISAGLVGICLVGTLIHKNQPGEDRPALIVELSLIHI